MKKITKIKKEIKFKMYPKGYDLRSVILIGDEPRI